MEDYKEFRRLYDEWFLRLLNDIKDYGLYEPTIPIIEHLGMVVEHLETRIIKLENEIKELTKKKKDDL